MHIIKVQVFGIGNQVINFGCGINNGCGSCGDKNHSCGDCGKDDCKSNGIYQNRNKTMMEAFKELVKFVKESDIGDKVNLEFIDMDKIGNIHPYNVVLELMDRGFELPITIIDGIVRYYGGISGKLVYNDINELIL